MTTAAGGAAVTSGTARGVVFDLDGTLVDSLPDITSALNRALAAAGLPSVTRSQVEPAMGDGALELVAAVVDAATGGEPVEPHRIVEICDEFQRFYAASPAAQTAPFADAVPALRSLHAAGTLLAVCTNKTTDLARDVLAAVGLGDCMSAVIGRDSTRYPKPDGRHLLAVIDVMGLSADQVVYVGDNPIDLATARSAGVTYRHVAWGVPVPRAELLQRFGDLAALVASPPQRNIQPVEPASESTR